MQSEKGFGPDACFHCYCGASVWLSFNFFDWDDGDEYCLTVHSEYRTGGIFSRIKAALKLLRDGEHAGAEVLLSPEEANRLADAIKAGGNKSRDLPPPPGIYNPTGFYKTVPVVDQYGMPVHENASGTDGANGLTFGSYDVLPPPGARWPSGFDDYDPAPGESLR